MAKGSIITRVYTSDAYIPLKDVYVIYTQTNVEGRDNILSIQRTDSSGLTAPYEIDTPDSSVSLIPGSTLTPYSSINISVAHPGYSTITAKGVQIFPGIETIQGFQLQPLATQENNATTVIPQSKQNL